MAELWARAARVQGEPLFALVPEPRQRRQLSSLAEELVQAQAPDPFPGLRISIPFVRGKETGQ